MDGWMDRWMNRWTERWKVKRRMHGQSWTGEWTDGWTDKETDGWESRKEQEEEQAARGGIQAIMEALKGQAHGCHTVWVLTRVRPLPPTQGASLTLNTAPLRELPCPAQRPPQLSQQPRSRTPQGWGTTLLPRHEAPWTPSLLPWYPDLTLSSHV